MKQTREYMCNDVSLTYTCGKEALLLQNGDHCHDKYEITYLISAEGSYIVEGSEHKVTRGALILITPMSYHKVELDGEADTECFTLRFSKGCLSDHVISLIDNMVESSDNRGRFYKASSLPDELLSCFERFSVSARLDDKSRTAYMQALLSEIIVLISLAEGESMVGAEEELGARVARYINTNVERSINLDRLARRFFVSKYHLCRAFKSYSGISPHAYINRKRIIHAKGLIESGMTASGAAERVGFGDYSAFYRAYVKIVGKAPTEK